MTEKQENLFMRSVNEYSIRESLAFYHESYALICENFAFCQESCDWFACTLKFRVSSQIFLFLLTCFIERNAFVLEWSAFYRKKFIDRKILYKLYDNKLKTLSCHLKWVHVHMNTMYFHIDNLFTNVNPLLTISIKLNPWTDLKGVRIF